MRFPSRLFVMRKLAAGIRIATSRASFEMSTPMLLPLTSSFLSPRPVSGHDLQNLFRPLGKRGVVKLQVVLSDWRSRPIPPPARLADSEGADPTGSDAENDMRARSTVGVQGSGLLCPQYVCAVDKTALGCKPHLGAGGAAAIAILGPVRPSGRDRRIDLAALVSPLGGVTRAADFACGVLIRVNVDVPLASTEIFRLVSRQPRVALDRPAGEPLFVSQSITGPFSPAIAGS